MTGSFDLELNRIFNDYDKSKAGTAEKPSDSELFRQRFRDMRRSTFIPVMETIAASLASRGVHTKLLTEKELPDSGNEPFVTLLLQVDMSRTFCPSSPMAIVRRSSSHGPPAHPVLPARVTTMD